MSSTGVVAREAFGVTRLEFMLEKREKNKKEIDRGPATKNGHDIRCFPVKIGHFYAGGLLHESAIGFCIDGPG
jgi:hypothetical protein